MSEINLIFIRHGEAAESWGEHPDPGLSKNGISQSQKLISNPSLQSLENFMFISSPKSRAKMTAAPILKKYNKKLIIDNHFSEIPSSNIKASEKREWLKKVMTMNIDDLPTEVSVWRDSIISKTLSFTNNTIIFSHFMVMNVLASYANSEQRLLSFYPDYTSFIKIVLRNESIYSIEFDKEKKTKINI